MTRAAINSDATTPSPSQSVRYADVNGIRASVIPRRAKGSRTAVTMCRTRNTTAVRERYRCMNCERKRGHVGDAPRVLRRIPRTTTAVSSSSDTRPAPRVTYHSTLGFDAIRREGSRPAGTHDGHVEVLTSSAAGHGRLLRRLQARLRRHAGVRRRRHGRIRCAGASGYAPRSEVAENRRDNHSAHRTRGAQLRRPGQALVSLRSPRGLLGHGCRVREFPDGSLTVRVRRRGADTLGTWITAPKH